MKRTIIRAAAMLLLSVSVAGCGMVRVNEERDRKLTVAVVNGEKIQKEEFIEKYELSRLSYPYQMTGEEEKEFKLQVLDSIIREHVVLQKAEKAGHVVNDDIRAEARQDFEDAIKDYAGQLEEEDKDTEEDENGETAENGDEGQENEEPKDYQKMAEEQYDAWLSQMGYTRDKYIELIAVDKVVRAYMDEMTDDVAVTDDAVKEFYDTELEKQKSNPQNIYYSPVAIVTEPEMRRVKHVLVKLPDEDRTKIQSLRGEKKDQEADEYRAEKLEALKAKAEEVLAKAKAGEDFEALIEEYGEDPGMKDEQNKDGYTVLRDGQMVEEFEDACFELRTGDISGLVATDHGYHIIKVYEDKDNVIASFDDKKEEIKTSLENQEKNKKWTEIVDGWVEEANIKKYEGRL